MRISDGLLEYQVDDNVTAFTTTREGGCSIGAYASFNANMYCGDDIRCVRQNQLTLCRKLGISHESLIIPHQVHDTNIAVIDKQFLNKSEAVRTQELDGVDALVTDQCQVAVCISTADCVPVIVYDAVHHTAAVIHAGWRGTVSRIVEKVMDRMNELYNTQGEDCKAVIGPSISIDCFEVGDEVYEAFKTSGFDMDRIAARYQSQGGTKGKRWHIDLWECNRLQLESKKINTGNILIAGICTYKNYNRLFSARRMGIKSGRLLTGVILR